MPTLRLFARAAAALVLVIAVAGCAGYRDPIPPQVRLADLRPAVSGGLLEQRFRLDLRVTNPNDFDLDIRAISVDLDLNGQPFASGLSNQSATVPALGNALVPVELSSGILEVARQLLGITQSTEFSYRLKGTAYLGGIGQDSVQSGSLGLGSSVDGLTTYAPR
jgi:hypothetical protein